MREAFRLCGYGCDGSRVSRDRWTTYLMLESIERPITQGTLVRPRNLALVHVQGGLQAGPYSGVIGIEPASDWVGSWESR
jgi:hypothetical protein